MKCLVTYESKYGNTKQYAEWIAEELTCDIKTSKEANGNVMAGYDVIIHGGGLYAGNVSGLKNVIKNFERIKDKEIIVFSCGLADPSLEYNINRIEEGIAKMLTPEMQQKIKQFHLRGGIDYGKLSFIHRIMMAGLRKALLSKGYENLREEDKQVVDSYGKKVEMVDKDMIKPLVEYVRAKANA